MISVPQLVEFRSICGHSGTFAAIVAHLRQMWRTWDNYNASKTIVVHLQKLWLATQGNYGAFEAKIVPTYGKFDYSDADAAITAHVYYVRQNALCQPYHILKSVCLYLKWFVRYGAFEAKIVPNYGKLTILAQMRQLRRMFIMCVRMPSVSPMIS